MPSPREGRDLAQEMAERSVTLLKNDGILPLGVTATRSPSSARTPTPPHFQYPAYSFPAARAVGVFMAQGGFNNMVGDRRAPPDGRHLGHAAAAAGGVGPSASTASSACPRSSRRSGAARRRRAGYGHPGRSRAATPSPGRSTPPATRTSSCSPSAGASAWFVGDRTEGEASDSLSIDLPAVQRRLIDAVIALGKPTVVVLVTGRPYVLPASLLERRRHRPARRTTASAALAAIARVIAVR